MSTSISIGFSRHPDPEEAILQACLQVKTELNSTDTDLIILFACASYVVDEILSIITRILKPKHLIGSSTKSIIVSSGVWQQGVAIAAINSDEMKFGVARTENLDSQDLRLAGFELARASIQDLNSTQRDLFITLSNGIEKDSSGFIRGLKEALGGAFPLSGAISSDNFKYNELTQFYQDQILHNTAVGLLIESASDVALACTHSFTPLGKPRTITKLQDCLVHSIDNKPAIELYRHFLGPDLEESQNSAFNGPTATYPLGVPLEESRAYLLRNMIDILKDGSIVCHEGFALGAEVHLMISSQESCHCSAIEAATLIKTSLGDKPAKLIIIFESLIRHKILGNSTADAIQAIKDILGATTPIIGMSSYGELAPFNTLKNIKNVYMHNASLLITAIA